MKFLFSQKKIKKIRTLFENLKTIKKELVNLTFWIFFPMKIVGLNFFFLIHFFIYIIVLYFYKDLILSHVYSFHLFTI